jgi:hypothetical protein
MLQTCILYTNRKAPDEHLFTAAAALYRLTEEQKYRTDADWLFDYAYGTYLFNWNNIFPQARSRTSHACVRVFSAGFLVIVCPLHPPSISDGLWAASCVLCGVCCERLHVGLSCWLRISHQVAFKHISALPAAMLCHTRSWDLLSVVQDFPKLRGHTARVACTGAVHRVADRYIHGFPTLMFYFRAVCMTSSCR